MVKLDTDIKRDIELELRWDPDIDATDIAVSVKNGVVTVTGFVPKYTQKHDAERDAERVAGVVGLANDIEVRLPVIDQRPDPEIARDVVAGIEKALPFSSKRIKALVGNGWITLEGEVEWNFQRERAESAVRRVRDHRR
ncbi:MAG: BON domain-containing protein [Limisphaerales bacterium]